jgi:hypothetical protein
MAIYTATEQTYLANSKASVIFQKREYEPRNKAEEELLEVAFKKGMIKKLDAVIDVEEVEKAVNEEADILSSLRGEYKDAHPENKDVPNNKKNDIERMKEKIKEFKS